MCQTNPQIISANRESDDIDTVKLVVPTDFDILEEMSDGKRYTGNFLGPILDKDDQYVRNRLAELRGKGLVKKEPNSQMYVITEKGLVVLHLQDQYDHDRTQDFAREVGEELVRRERCECDEDPPNDRPGVRDEENGGDSTAGASEG